MITQAHIAALRQCALGHAIRDTAAVSTLLSHHLIRVSQSGQVVTPKGEAWLRAHGTRGKLPNVAPAKPRRVAGRIAGNPYAENKYKD